MGERKAIAVLGLGYGDEGKGSVVDFLSTVYKGADVVRFNGGPQAAHHVVRPDGVWHCFSHIGSGTFNGSRTYLYKDMVVSPELLRNEYLVLREKYPAYKPVFIHPDCRVVIPFHKALSQAKAEITNNSTTGLGVGPASAYGLPVSIHFRDFFGLKQPLKEKMEYVREAVNDYLKEHGRKPCIIKQLDKGQYRDMRNMVDYYRRLVRDTRGIVWEPWPEDLSLSDTVILEGAQGALLDYEHGFYPYVSPVNSRISDSTLLDLEISDLFKLGVTRTYLTRHGKGPLITENRDYSGSRFVEEHNQRYGPQGMFRGGDLDRVSLKYATDICGGIDGIFLTNIDRTLDRHKEIYLCENYTPIHDPYSDKISHIPFKERTIEERQQLTESLSGLSSSSNATKGFRTYHGLIPYLKNNLGLKTIGRSFGPTWKDKVFEEPFGGKIIRRKRLAG